MSAAPQQSVAFGSGQERKLFPLHHAPDRMGVETLRPEGPHHGPGCYDNHEFDTIVYNLEKTPHSKKGFGFSARTTERFPPRDKTETPSQKQDQSRSRILPPLPPGKTYVGSVSQRFKTMSRTIDESPGPGTYVHDTVTNRRVSWPMCFGRPDWSRLPQVEKTALRVKLQSEKDFIKHRSRVAYLSLYY